MPWSLIKSRRKCYLRNVMATK